MPNGHLAGVLLRRAFVVTARGTPISMEGADGSYLLETLTNFVCDRAGSPPFDHELYVTAVKDLALFGAWPTCRGYRSNTGRTGVGC